MRSRRRGRRGGRGAAERFGAGPRPRPVGAAFEVERGEVRGVDRAVPDAPVDRVDPVDREDPVARDDPEDPDELGGAAPRTRVALSALGLAALGLPALGLPALGLPAFGLARPPDADRDVVPDVDVGPWRGRDGRAAVPERPEAASRRRSGRPGSEPRVGVTVSPRRRRRGLGRSGLLGGAGARSR
jgi:GLTT repeat-containing protein